MSNKTPNPSAAMLWFFILTTLYFPLKYYLKSSEKVITIGYILLIIIIEYVINLDLTDKICGSNQVLTAIFVTAIPWILIFGVFNLMIMLFPGWLTPFSNTFGYGFVKILGLSKVIHEIFKPKATTNLKFLSNSDKNIQQSLAQIYGNESLLINQITPSNFSKFWDTSSILFKSGVKGDPTLKGKLENFVRIKYFVSEYIWYILIGSLITSASYNYILNAGCKKPISVMNNNDDKIKEIEKKKLNKEPETVYKITD
jgi:hypothetical protein